LTEIGKRHGLTAEGARYVMEKAADAHLKKVVAQMHEAQDQGGFMVMAIKGSTGEELAERVKFGVWVLERLPKYGVDAELHLAHLSDAIVISVFDRNYHSEGEE